MPYRFYAVTGLGWSKAPVVFESADKVVESALKMINHDRRAEVEAPDLPASEPSPAPVSSPRVTAVQYRFHQMAISGVSSSAQDADFSSDVEAMIHAGSLVQAEGSVEIWRGARFVGEIGRWFSRWGPARTFKAQPGLRALH